MNDNQRLTRDKRTILNDEETGDSNYFIDDFGKKNY